MISWVFDYYITLIRSFSPPRKDKETTEKVIEISERCAFSDYRLYYKPFLKAFGKYAKTHQKKSVAKAPKWWLVEGTTLTYLDDLLCGLLVFSRW